MTWTIHVLRRCLLVTALASAACGVEPTAPNTASSSEALTYVPGGLTHVWFPPPPPPMRYPRYDEVFATGTHNSYWVNRNHESPDTCASGTEERLLDQLAFEHVRSIELDLHRDDPRPGSFSVYHTDNTHNSFCSNLADCVDQLRTFHYTNPTHEVVTVVLELKELDGPEFDELHTPEQLDATLEAGLGPELYRPSDFLARCPGQLHLRDCAAQVQWPTIDQLRGKFIFVVLGNEEHASAQGPQSWARYATPPGGIASRSAFPMISPWNANDAGSLAAAATAESIFVQVELDRSALQTPGGTAFLQTVVPPGAIARGDVNIHPSSGGFCQVNWDGRGGYSQAVFTLDDQNLIRDAGLQIVQTDHPWYSIDWGGQQHPFMLLPGSAYSPASVDEPGHRLLLAALRDGAHAFAYTTRAASGTTRWETFPSSTRPATASEYPNPRRTRGEGCLRAQVGSRAAGDPGADAVSICRHTRGGDEEAIVTFDTVRGGHVVHAEAHGELVKLDVSNVASGSSCATGYYAARVGADGTPAWQWLGTQCFSEPLAYQGLAARDGDVLFVNARLDGDAISARDLRLTSLGGPGGDGGFAVRDLSWPRTDLTCVRDARGGCLVAVQRAYRAPQHFYTTDVVEASNWGFEVEAASYFWLEASAQPGDLPLYRCLQPAVDRHFLTADASCEGAGTNEGRLGYMSTAPVAGTVPLYRAYSPGADDHFYTIDAGELAAASRGGYHFEATVGYVWR